MLSLIQNLIPDDVLRAKVLAIARHVGQWAAGLVFGAVLAFLLSKGVDKDSATVLAAAIASAVAALVVAVIMGAFAVLDVRKVAVKTQQKVTQAVNITAGGVQQGMSPDDAKAAALKALQVGT